MKRAGLLAIAASLTLGGCVERTIDVRSNPPNALVFMNDQEAGRTPFSHRFIWYGTYEVQVRKDGYQTLKTASPVIAPWWQWVPFDFVAEVLPFHFQDNHTLRYTLKPVQEKQENPDVLIGRAQQLREQLEYGKSGPSTRPAPSPATRPARKTDRG